MQDEAIPSALVTPDIISEKFGSASASMLLAILDQSPDCIKILSLDGCLEYMNRNGRCAMEIEDFGAVAGARWADLWPCDAQPMIENALGRAAEGEMVHFRSACPTAKGSPRWWDVSVSQFDAGSGSQGFISISRDVTGEVQEQNAAEAIAAEMRHRLGNAYHIVGSLLSSFARGDPEKEQFASDMTARLGALAAAQSMHAAEGINLPLPDVVAKLVRPYETPDAPIFIASLPMIQLEQGETDSLAMVLGELSVNSIKHGALRQGGRIEITGSSEDGCPNLIWSEQMPQKIVSHTREGGKGLLLMQRVMRARGGDINFEWLEHALKATIRLNKR